MKKRDCSLDIGQGLMMLHMISFHLRGYALVDFKIGLLEDFMFFFFMPWFFFKAGIFWKQNTLSDVIKQGYKRLLRPFIIFSILGHVLYCIRLIIEGDYYWAHYVLSPFKSLLRYGCVTGNDPLWFLLTLFLVRVVYTTLKKYHVSTIYIVSFCAFWGFLCNQLSIVTEPRYMGNFFTGLLFYSTGHFWTNFEGKILPPPYKKYLVASIMIFTILVYFVYPSAVDLFYNKTLYGNYFIWIIHSILCIITLNNLLKRVPDFQVLRSIGEYSMTYYVFHRLIIFGVQNVFIYLNLPSVGVPVFIWSSIMCIIFLPIITKYYKL